MNKTAYEITWHYDGDTFSHCTVTPITILREGVLPGCAAVSITAKGASGNKFLGSPTKYYATEEAAWATMKAQLANDTKDLKEMRAMPCTAQQPVRAPLTAELVSLLEDWLNSFEDMLEGGDDEIVKATRSAIERAHERVVPTATQLMKAQPLTDGQIHNLDPLPHVMFDSHRLEFARAVIAEFCRINGIGQEGAARTIPMPSGEGWEGVA